MSDLIARLEDLADDIVDQDGHPCGDYWQCVHETLAKDFRSAAAALRHKEVEVHALGIALAIKVSELGHERRARESLEAQISALRDQQPVAWMYEHSHPDARDLSLDRWRTCPGKWIERALVYAHQGSPERPAAAPGGEA